MPILSILLALLIVGVVLWAINNYLPLDGNIKKIFNVVVIVITIIWLLKEFGAWHYLASIHI